MIDDDGIREVLLYYREASAKLFTPMVMESRPLDVYTATIPGHDVHGSDVEYYIYAVDKNGQDIPAFLSRTTPEIDPLDQQALEQVMYRVRIESGETRTWTWVVLGALAAGVAVALQDSGSASDGGGPSPRDPGEQPAATIDVTGPVPQ